MDGTVSNGFRHYISKEKKRDKWEEKLLEAYPYGLNYKLRDEYTTTRNSFIGITFPLLGRSLS